MASEGTILLVEDDKDLNDANSRALWLRGYDVRTAMTLAEARERLNEAEPDVILLDAMLPDGDGVSFCAEIRGATQAHILFLTAKSEHEDMVKGLATGGDDYITKPFHMDEMLARVEAAIRRRKIGVPLKTVVKGKLTFDLIASQAFVDGANLLLTHKEFHLLLLLAQNEDKAMSANYLYENAWGQPMEGDKNAVQVAISRLRGKIEPAGYDIDTIRGKGYVFEKM